MRFFYLIGNPRSGTSMFRLMLNAHPAIVAPPECGFIQWLYPKYRHSNLGDPSIQELFIQDVLGSKKMETWNITAEELRVAFSESKTNAYSGLCFAVIQAYGRKSGKAHPEVLVDKNNYYLNHLETISEAIPEARFIHLVRDVRDVACSYLNLQKEGFTEKYSPKLPSDIEAIGAEWVENNERVSNFMTQVDHKVVRYEDLVADTEGVLNEVLNYLGLPFHERVLEFYKYNDEPKETMGWKTRTLLPPDPTRIGQYKELLSVEANELLERIASKTLEKYGYE